jgi:iron complex outermembrane recepter protein
MSSNNPFWSRRIGVAHSKWTRLVALRFRQRPTQPPPIKGSRLRKIIVTAENREERLQDVPIPITPVSGQTLLLPGISPLGAGSGVTAGGVAPDFDSDDSARVKVLRESKGILYGASILGGLIRFVTVEPSTDFFEAGVSAGTDGVQNGAGLGYTFRALANMPLTTNLAIRACRPTRSTSCL